jgi:hypothetical protein
MNAGRDRPSPPVCTAVSATVPNSDTAGAPSRPKDSTDKGSNGGAEENQRQVHCFVLT